MSDSSITAAGNLTRDPEQASERHPASFGLAVNRRWRAGNGDEWQEETSFFEAICWGDLATNAMASLRKGDRVVVSGRLTQQRWVNDDGENRSVVKIVADDIGPSLRWAQTDVRRITRASDGGRQERTQAPAAQSEEPGEELF